MHSSSSAASGLYWWLLFMVFSTFLPLTDLIWRLRTSRISDWHITRREERTWPMVFGVIYAAAGFAAFCFLSGPLALQACMLSGLSLGVISLSITSFWKISLHVMGDASLAVIIYLAFDILPASPIAFILILCILAVGISRLAVKAHTPLQVLAGAAAGAGLTWAIFTLMCVPV